MSEIPGATGDVVWQSSPPGSIYDYIRVASFSIGPDGLIEQWSRRAAGLFGMAADEAIGRDPVEAFMPAELRSDGHRRVGEILDGKEWTGLVPFRMPGEGGAHGLAEVYVMPSETADGERAALCIVVDVRALRRIETDLAASQAIFGQSPFGFVLFGTDFTVVRANQRFATVFGGAADDHRGRTVDDYLPGPEAERLGATLKRVMETGESVTDLQLVGPTPGGTGRRHWSMNLYRVHSGAGRPVGVAGLATDVTRRHIAAREAASARRNLALLNEASARIGNSLDLETTARELLDVAVPGFCDLATVDLYQGLLTGEEAAPGSWAPAHRESAGGSAELRRVAHASAVADALPTAVAGSGAPGPGDLPPALGSVHRFPFGSPCAIALRSGHVEAVPGDDMGFVQSTLAVPMVAHDTVVGLVQFSRTKGSEPFGERTGCWPPSWPPAPPSASTTPASTAASTNAPSSSSAACCPRRPRGRRARHRLPLPPRQHRHRGRRRLVRRHRTAGPPHRPGRRRRHGPGPAGRRRDGRTPHRRPDAGPPRPGARRGALRPGRGRTRPRLPGRRRAQRGARRQRGIPVALPRRAEVAGGGPLRGVPRHLRVRGLRPGHPTLYVRQRRAPPPAVVEPGRPARLIDVPPGMPLGVGGEPFEEVEVELAENALLTLYTDGLVESRDQPLDEGLDALRAVLTGPQMSLEDACDFVLSTLDTRHGEDDIALLMARIQGLPGEAVGDWTLPREPRSVGRARELARSQLMAWDLDDLVDTTELLVSELVTNALRYGEGEIRLRLLRDRTLVCEVWDAGLVQPRRRRARDTDEGGRGLQLVGLLSAAWGARRTPRGKTVWFELALPTGAPAAELSVEQLLSMY